MYAIQINKCLLGGNGKAVLFQFNEANFVVRSIKDLTPKGTDVSIVPKGTTAKFTGTLSEIKEHEKENDEIDWSLY